MTATLPSPPPAPGAPEQAASPPGGGRALRLVVVPTPQPPALDGPVRLVVPGLAPPRPPHRPGPRPRVPGAPAADFGPCWSAREDLPDVRAAGRRLFTVALEALAGRRPLSQVQPLTSVGVYGALSGGRRPPWCVTGTAPLVLGPVHVCEPVDGVAEVSAVARRAGRAHAVAARLEGIDGRWRCTALQIG
ncbi:MAG TPA: Rv3235 family protein [Geodermatophilus sp.]|nr:Rv3235 family protein [Geodermatophilus sp.]